MWAPGNGIAVTSVWLGSCLDAAGEHDRADQQRAHEGDAGGVAAGALERLREAVYDERERGRPPEGADGGGGEELPEREAGRTGDERCQRSKEPDETHDENHLRAVAVEEPFDPVDELAADPQARAVG